MPFFGSLMGDLDDDPIFGSHMRSMRHMNNMMNSLFTDPFGMMAHNVLTEAHHRGRNRHNELQMLPFGFPPMPSFNMDRLFGNFDNMPGNGNSHSFMSSSVMTMASGPDGRPQVYQETMSTRTAPGGVKETKKTVCDSRSGTKKMAIGHHIGERAHILEREQNVHSGTQEEHQEFINLEEEEAESFNNEWESRTRHSAGAIRSATHSGPNNHNRHHTEHKQLALPDAAASRHLNRSRWMPSPRRSIRPLPSTKNLDTASSTRSDTRAPVVVAPHSVVTSTGIPSGSRKRQHSSNTKHSNKRQADITSNI